MSHIIADWALLDDGFAPDVRISFRDGEIVAIEPDAGRGGVDSGGERVRGLVLPGMTDLHSHAFQRSFAGCAEFAGGGTDFWSWREAMYRAAGRIEPDTLAPIAAWLGMEKLRGGYTSLVEFHYLHHQRDGTPYAERGAMATALVDGARRAGIGMTLLFGIYETADFGGAALEPGQIRFANDADQALAMLQAAAAFAGPELRLGLAPHSLRAVRPASLDHAAAALARIDAAAPIHIHVAEQVGEVAACEASYGTTPVAWLLDHAPVGPAWCLIHATHTTAREVAGIAASCAVTGLCPSTEGNLGDGIFDVGALLGAAGRLGIGTDSNVSLDAFGELRLLEYVQRLATRRRNVLVGLGKEEAGRHSGRVLWQVAARGGAAAAARNTGRIAVGFRADFVVVDASAETASQAPDFWLDAAVFTALRRPARHVMVGGRWMVRDYVHVDEAAIERGYRAALARLGA